MAVIDKTGETVCTVKYHHDGASASLKLAEDWPTALRMATDEMPETNPRITFSSSSMAIIQSEKDDSRVSIRERGVYGDRL